MKVLEAGPFEYVDKLPLNRGYLASGNLSVVMAAMSLAVLPVILIFLLAQTMVIDGVTMSGRQR